MPIDWSKLQPYKATKHKSFEQLCYQIAVRLYGEQNVFTAIDDSGGGDGVEFYLTLPDGTEWGWQAKYYEDSPRLHIKGRKGQIITSLKRALEIHPKLSRWFLCLPIELTPNETAWVRNVLPTHIPKGRVVEIIRWTESFLHEKLSLPLYSGLRHYFFNILELSDDWFLRTFETAFALVKNKFDEFLYVTNEQFEYLYLDPLLCNEKFRIERLLPFLQDAEEQYEGAKEDLEWLKQPYDVRQPLWEECVRRCSEINDQIAALLSLLRKRMRFITPNLVAKITDTDFAKEMNTLILMVNDFDRYISLETNVGTFLEARQYEREYVERTRQVRHLDNVYSRIIDAARNLIPHSVIPNEYQVAHYLGNGGDGKTNLAVALAKRYLNSGHPVIFIPALLFTSALPLSEQILSLLHIQKNYTFHNFLDVLNEAGRIQDIRIPIILDGLNEATGQDGYFNRVIATSLPSLEAAVRQKSNLVLITTCRPSYKTEIWNEINGNDNRFHHIYGFTDYSNKKKLVRTYFSYYKIEADLSFSSLVLFSKPLYLKIYCESTNPSRQGAVAATLGFDSIYPVFDRFIARCDDSIYQRMKKVGNVFPGDQSRTVASRVLRSIAGHLWQHPNRVISIEELRVLVDGPQLTPWKDSITKALLEDELLLMRDWHHQRDSVFLTYDLLAGYLIADYLISETPDVQALISNENRQLLDGEEFRKRHPNHADIVGGLCGLLPMRKRVFLHELLKAAGEPGFVGDSLFERSVITMLTLSSELIPPKQILFVSELADNPQHVIELLSAAAPVWFTPGHPFNFTFWSERLRRLPMNERDITWSEYLRRHGSEVTESIVSELQELLNKAILYPPQLERIDLVVTFLIWTFTSTNRKLKQGSADGLYKFGLRFTDQFIGHYYQAVSTADITVSEWMHSVLYHVLSTVLKTSPELYAGQMVPLALFLEKNFFNETGAYATGHLLIRESAFDSLALLAEVYPEVGIDPAGIRDRFSRLGITQWQKAADQNLNGYRDGNSLIDYHFNKEKMPYITEGKGSEYDSTPHYREVQAKLRWRAYGLGYRFEWFGRIDSEIANQRHYDNDHLQATERLADKYIGIAFLEYCGFLEARGRMKDFRDYGYARAFEPMYEPVPEAGDPASDFLSELFTIPSFIDTGVSLTEWTSNDKVPDMEDYLSKTFDRSSGNQWVLIDGIIRQHRQEYERQIFIRLDVFFIKSRDKKKAQKAFTKATRLGWANSKPHSENVHLSEIPDGRLVPHNEFETWEYEDRSRNVENSYVVKALFRTGKELDSVDADILWNETARHLGYGWYPREWLQGFRTSAIRSLNSLLNHDSVQTVEEALERKGIEIKEKEVRRTERKAINRSVQVLAPVRILKEKAYLCKNIIEALHLKSKGGTTDLFDIQGEIASFNRGAERNDFDREAFTYLRKDLLEDYMRSHDLTMYTLVWGERDYYPMDGNWSDTSGRIQNRRWSKFYEAIIYQMG